MANLGTWGPITFEVSADRIRTWNDARRSADARWHAHEVYAGKPVKEFLGPGDEKVTLQVRLDADRGIDVPAELRDLREQRDIGAQHPLIIGGELQGDFYLKGISEQWKRTDKNGVVIVAIVDLAFEEYV